jgi:hypothetical protein
VIAAIVLVIAPENVPVEPRILAAAAIRAPAQHQVVASANQAGEVHPATVNVLEASPNRAIIMACAHRLATAPVSRDTCHSTAVSSVKVVLATPATGMATVSPMALVTAIQYTGGALVISSAPALMIEPMDLFVWTKDCAICRASVNVQEYMRAKTAPNSRPGSLQL